MARRRTHSASPRAMLEPPAAPRRGGGPSRRRFQQVDAELIRKVLVPYKLIRSYCRVTVEGLENIPGQGPAVIAANHTGWLGLDYANLAMCIHDALGRFPRGVVHPLWFATPRIRDVASRLGLVPADKDLMVEIVRQKKLLIIFPEAEHGAFKTTTEVQYRLEEFKRGFVRVAMETKAPIVPVAILGGEEANPVLGQLQLTDRLFRLPLPRPANILPRPVKWRISFLPAIPMERYTARDASKADLVHRLAADVRSRIQDELELQIEKRGHKYI